VGKISAIAWLRMKLLLNGLRGDRGRADLVSAVVLSLMWTAGALGMAAVFATVIWQAEHPADLDFLLLLYYLVFFVCTVCSVVMPLLFESGRRKLEIARLRHFPISYRRLFGLSLGACVASSEQVLCYPTLLAVGLFGIILPGVNVAAGFLLISSLWIFNLVWGHTVALGIEAAMKRRTGKEILIFISFLFLIFVGIGPAFMERLLGEQWTRESTVFQGAVRNLILVGKTLAPALAAEGLGALRRGEVAPALRGLAWLWVWIVPGAVLGYFVFVRYHIDGEYRARRFAGKPRMSPEERTRAAWSRGSSALSFLSEGVLAVAVKDWRYLRRSMVGKFNLVLVPVFVTMGALMFARDREAPLLWIDIEPFVLFSILLFVTKLASHLVNNCFAWEGSGVQSYFLCPTRLRSVILGKNLAAWGYNGVLFVLAVTTWSVVKGMPGGMTLLTGFVFYAVAVLSFTSIGNFLSIAFPVPKDVSARDSSISQTGLLISFAGLAVVAAVVWAFLTIPVLIGWPALQPLSLAALFAVQVVVYRRTLRLAERSFMNNREKIITALCSRPLGLTGN
jgi:ABC-2 type transport system permease protein